MEKKPKTLVLLDGNALIHRSYHALPPLTTKEGQIVNAVYGVTMTFLSVLEKFKPEYIAATFDLAGGTFRDDMYKEYKAKRTKAPDDLYAQIPLVKEMVKAFNVPIYEKEGFEADDCIGTLARQAEKQGVEVIIVTGDMDTLQLVSPLVKVFTMRKGIKDTVIYDEKAVVEKYGLTPEQIADYKGLRGDASDNIPGVKGIGEKTASVLLQKYKTLEGVYAALDEIKPAIREKLEKDRENAFLSRELGRIHIACPVNLNLEDAVSREYDRNHVVELFRKFEFFSLLKRLPGAEDFPETEDLKKKVKKAKRKELKEEKEIVEFLKTAAEKVVAVSIEKEEDSLFGAGLKAVHFALSQSEDISIAWNEKTKEQLRNFLEDKDVKKIAYDAKKIMHVFDKEGVRFEGIIFDVLIAAYLLNSGGDMDFEYLVLAESGEELDGASAPLVHMLHDRYEEKLDEISKTQTAGKTLRTVFEEIEMPLLPILFKMEKDGICLNGKKLEQLSQELTKEIVQLEKDIYAFAGKEFNINSPKQLAVILFEDLKISSVNIKKTKTGISTASPELAKLKDYPIVLKVENYRELTKLKNTYLDVLPALIWNDGRIHTTFHQAVAATGRLSSADPNLQNIPARSIWSERIRGAFEAREGDVLVGADYSQIELRVMAHLSQDKALMDAFLKGEDVHKTTASVVYKVKLEEVTPEMRQQAKIFNFGIMYGMGAYGLSQAAQIDQKEAAEFIKAYFKKFSGVAEFIEGMKEGARKNHYVETEFGRRRYIPEIESGNVQVARAAERMAINMPIQGMEADIVKVGMLAAEKTVEKYGDDARMVLQVHDELIFEVKKERAEEFAKEIKEVMGQVFPLRVPLIAETCIGKNWGEI